jgi:hypothetical protein
MNAARQRKKMNAEHGAQQQQKPVGKVQFLGNVLSCRGCRCPFRLQAGASYSPGLHHGFIQFQASPMSGGKASTLCAPYADSSAKIK